MKHLTDVIIKQRFAPNLALGQHPTTTVDEAGKLDKFAQDLEDAIKFNDPWRMFYASLVAALFAVQLSMIFISRDQQVTLLLLQGSVSAITVAWPLRKMHELLVARIEMTNWIVFCKVLPYDTVSQMAIDYVRKTMRLPAIPRPTEPDTGVVLATE